jgi:signal transduction histidine kinase
MQIRTRLTLQFILVVTLIILLGFSVIYFSAASYNKKEFLERLENKARTTADIFMATGQIDSTTMRFFDRMQRDRLPFEKVTIFNSDYREIYTSYDSSVFVPPPKLLQKIQEKGRIETEAGQLQIVGFSFSSKSRDFVVCAAAVDRFGNSKLNNLRYTMGLLFVFIISIAAFSGWVYAGRALRPLSDVINEVENINVNRLDTRLNQTGYRDEIGRLIDTFNILLKRVESSFKMQKLFLSGASHELKNPLTAITSQLQVILLNERSTEEYKTIIKSILQDIRRLNRTTLDLIEYAKLSYEEKIHLHEVRIDDVTWQCRDFYIHSNPGSRVIIRFDNMPEDENRLVINGNDALLKVAFINLIDNACKFSENKTCTVHLKVNDHNISVSFSDNGIGLTRDEIDLIFEPFYRANSTTETKGHGIGLALTRKIIQLHDADIVVNSEKGKGAEFSVQFHNVA